MFGLFQSYALGNIYAAQFRHALVREMPDFEARVRRGDLLSIKIWLNHNIHRHGKMLTANQLVETVSGEPVSAKFLIDYLEAKFSKLYHL